MLISPEIGYEDKGDFPRNYRPIVLSTKNLNFEKNSQLESCGKFEINSNKVRISSLKSLTGLPPSVFERAKEYRLVEEFLRFNVKTKLWD